MAGPKGFMSRPSLRGLAPFHRAGASPCGYSLAVRTGASQALNPGSNPGGRTPLPPARPIQPRSETYLGESPPPRAVRNPRRARQAQALAVALLFSPALLLAPAEAAPQPLAGTPVDLNLWIHADDTLSMAGNANEQPNPSSATTRDFQMANGFQKDVCIDGVDIGSGRQGFQVVLDTAFVVPTSGTNITIRVKDEAFSTLAEDNFAYPSAAFPRPQTNSIWNINFTGARASAGCTVLKGHRLILEFTSPVTLGWGNYRNAHIAMRVTDPIAPTGHTENTAGPATTFFPNDVDGSRAVVFNGSLGNAFTDALVSVVRITIKDPALNAIDNATGSVNLGNWTFTWNYPRSSPGSYSAAIQVQDTQGHTYNTSISFTFAAYGLRINTQGQSGGSVTRYTTTGAPADYELTISNVGGSATIATMLTETAPPAGWAANFTPASLALDPGASATSHFLVSPSPSLGPGNSSQITVVALASTDPSPIKARDTLSTTTVIEREIFLTITPSSTAATSKLAGVTRYDFTLTNNGGQPTDVTFNATAAPAGWTRSLLGDLVAEGDGWRLVGLEGNGGTRILTLEVDAPAQAPVVSTFACTVTARSVQNASAVSTFVGTTTLLLGIELFLVSPTSEPKDVSPGGFVDFQFEIVNTDPLAFHRVNESDISVAEAGSPPNPQFVSGIDTGAINITAPFGCCDHGANGTLGVLVSLPQRALSGRYSFRLRVAYDGDPGKFAELNFTLVVRQVTAYFLRLDATPSQLTLKQGTVTVHGAIVSDGNYPVLVDLATAVMNGATLDPSWRVTLSDINGTAVGRVRLDPFSETPVTITITAPQSAFNGDHRDFHFAISIAPAGREPWTLTPPVDLVVELDSATVFARMWQNSFVLVILFFLLAVLAASMARRAIRGPRAPRPAPPPAAAPPAPAPDKPKGKPAELK